MQLSKSLSQVTTILWNFQIRLGNNLPQFLYLISLDRILAVPHTCSKTLNKWLNVSEPLTTLEDVNITSYIKDLLGVINELTLVKWCAGSGTW